MSRSEHAPIALVTGAAIRVGRAITDRLAASGHRVWIHCHRSEDAARGLASALGERALGVVKADLADETQRRTLCDVVLDPKGAGGGRVDLLVNNAASFERGRFATRSDADLRRVLETNLVAPVALVRNLLTALGRGPGQVINILDVAAFHPWRSYLDHCTAKAGLLMMTRGLAVELAPVRVNGVAPGTVLWPDDPSYGEGSQARARILSKIPLARIGSPEDVAKAVMFFAENDYVTGQVLAIDGGRSAASGSGYED